MSTEPAAAKPKLLWIKLAVVVVVLATGGLLMMQGVDVRGWIDRGMNLVRSTGPVTFFTAMALTPAVGVPASLFTLTAGTAFGPQLGIFWVMVLCMAAILVNVALTHWLARYALRPLLEKLMAKLGYKLPQVAAENTTDLAILVRVTPGSPFPVQNYLLGLAGVPLVRNLLVVFIVQLVYLPAFVLFGDAIQHGKGKVAMIALGLLAAAGAGTHLLRKHYAKKKKAG
ncbi:MAG: VTT domain-containing protein [Verrucomicrobia bacterium]|nr:VTT domain-containing protein [Verrucomicrobiota bacterium]